MSSISKTIILLNYVLLFNFCVLNDSATVSSDVVVVNRCPELPLEELGNNSLVIPGHLTEDGKNTEFRFSVNPLECVESALVYLLTKEPVVSNKDVSKQIGNISSNEMTESTTIISLKSETLPKGRFRLRGEVYDHFTSQGGALMVNSTYNNVNSYCISSVSDSTIVAKICVENLTTADGNNRLTSINIPKCCGLGQEVVYWKFSCRNSDENKWSPFIYSDAHNKLPVGDVEKINMQFSRPLLKCDNWERWPATNVQRPKNNNKPIDAKISWRLLKDGSIIFLNEQRQWLPLTKGSYCMDGFSNWGLAGNSPYSGLEKDQVILLCPDEVPQNPCSIGSFIPYLYASVLFVSSIFLLITALVHIALFEKLQVHGLTVLSHSISMFLMYIFLGLAYFTSGTSIDNKKDGIKKGTGTCISIGVLAHFFFLSTFAWLTIMNFDLWWTFRTIKPLGKVGKRMNRFRVYSGLGWGIPVSLITVFVALDFSYRDTESEIPVPDYGVKSCFVACYARGIYIYYILAILISVNIVFIVSTCITFIRFQKTTHGLSGKKTTKCDKYSFKLFGKLFFIMGVAWCFELYSYLQNPCNCNSSWHVIVLDFIMFLQALGNFVIFCCNERTISQLEEKYPKYKKFLKPIKQIFCLKTISSNDNYDLGTRASGGTMRKMSTTISQSQQTDQTS